MHKNSNSWQGTVTVLAMAGALLTLNLVVLGVTSQVTGAAPTATWSVTPTTESGVLQGVSCVSANDCVAVGTSNDQTLIETWDGAFWSVTPSPNPETLDQLFGVSCLSATDCVAVGYYYGPSGTTSQTLIETWDGTSWSVASNPGSGTDNSDDWLSGVSCVSGTDCVAVGYDNQDGKTLIVTNVTPSVQCAKMSGRVSSYVRFKSCTPTSPTNKSATAPSSVLVSGGTLNWARSGQTSLVSLKASSPGQGGCKKRDTEEDVT
jgi:hypothetical protein